MRRYLLTLRRFWGTALASQLEYQFNAAVELVAMLANLAGSLLVLWLFYRQGVSLGGWSWHAAQVVLGAYTALAGFTSTLLQPNLSRIVTQVQEGGLDFVLLKPVDSQFWLSLRSFSLAGLPELVLGLGLMLWAARQEQGALAPADLLAAALVMIAAALILYALWFALATTTIWFVKTWNATEVLRAALGAGRYPVSAFPPGLRLLFTLVFPVAFLTTVPAEVLLGRSSGYWVGASLGMAVLALALGRAFWQLALRSYTSASS
ncbi:MAG: ABC-2 family transporter protein [Cyanobium sp.]|nr:ABC-2 family transporter protein [Cyanobium sp.]